MGRLFGADETSGFQGLVLSLALMVGATPILAEGQFDAQGDATPLVHSSPDLIAVEARAVGESLIVTGSVALGSGSLDPDFAAGLTVIPGNTARRLGPVYRVSLDLDRNAGTGNGGAEHEVEVTFYREFPFGDPALGVRLIEPSVAAFRRSYNAGGSLVSSGLLAGAVARDGNGFSVEIPRAPLGIEESLDLRVTALLQWAGGACTDGLSRPFVCFSATDEAPDAGTSALHVGAGGVAEILAFDPEALIVGDEVDPQSVEVEYGPSGEKALLWRQEGSGAATEIRMQLLDSSERPRFLPVRVNEGIGTHELPTAAFDYSGELLVFWRHGNQAAAASFGDRTSIAPGSSVLGRRFGPNGLTLGTQQVIHEGGTQDSGAPAAATDAEGNTVVAWRDADAVRAKVIVKASGAPHCLPGVICTQGFEDHDIQLEVAGQRASVPQTAMSPFGDFVVAWQESNGATSGIVSRRFAPDGSPKETPKVVSDEGRPSAPSVAMNDRGEFVVAWEADGANGRDIFVRRFTSLGTSLGTTELVNESLAGDQRFPRVDANSRGTFAVVWQDLEAPSGRSVAGRVFHADGSPRVPEFVVAESEAGEDPGDADVAISDGDEVTFAYERRAPGGQAAGVYRRRAALEAVVAPEVPACEASSTVLCLGGRFQVTALWDDPSSGEQRAAFVEAVTNDTGYLWFFDATNVEVILKVLDGCSLNDRFWVFAAGLTHLPVRILVEDVATGEARTYFGRDRPFLSVRDTSALGGCDSTVSADPGVGVRVADWKDALLPALGDVADRSTVSCSPDSQRLCLAGSRFQVGVRYSTPSGAGGTANAVALTADSGYFWFFDQDNVEVIVKVLDACSVSGDFWVFAAGLTDLEVELEVVDTLTGQVEVYVGRQGAGFGPVEDTSSFPSCR